MKSELILIFKVFDRTNGLKYQISIQITITLILCIVLNELLVFTKAKA